MAGSTFALAAATLLAASAAVSAQECSADVSEAFIATIDNSTYFDTCAEGTTFNVTSVFDVLNFTDADFLTFCSSSTCLEPLHELMGSVDCLITYEGTARNRRRRSRSCMTSATKRSKAASTATTRRAWPCR